MRLSILPLICNPEECRKGTGGLDFIANCWSNFFLVQTHKKEHVVKMMRTILEELN